MKLYERVLLNIYNLLFIILALGVLLVALGWQAPLSYLQAVLSETQSRWALALGAGLVFIIAVKLFFDGFRREPVRQASVQKTEIGEVKITITAIENMVKKAAEKIKGVRDVKPKIKCTPEGVAVFIQAQVAPDLNIPQTTLDIQETVKNYLESVAGLNLLEAKVLIDHIAQDVKNRVE